MAKTYVGIKLQDLGTYQVLDPKDKIVLVKDKDEGVMTLKEFFLYVQSNLDMSNYYTSSQINAIFMAKADTYTRRDSDLKFALVDKTYTRTQSDSRFAIASDTYTKVESDSMYASRELMYTKDKVYTKEESIYAFALKTDIPAAPDLTPYSTTVKGDLRWALKTDVFSKTEADARFANINNVYTKTISDGRYALLSDSYTKTEIENKFLDNSEAYTKDYINLNIYTKNQIYTKVETDGKYALKTDVYTIAAINEQFAAKSWVYSRGDADNTFRKLIDSYTKNEVNSLIDARMSGVTTDVAAGYYTKTEVDVKFSTIGTSYTKNESDAKYALISNTLTASQTANKYYNKVEIETSLNQAVINSDARYSLKTESIKNISVSPAVLTFTKTDNTSATTGIPTWNQSTTGNAATATKLQTVKTIGIDGAVTASGIGFDGSSNININATSLDATKLTGVIPSTNLAGTYNVSSELGANELIYTKFVDPNSVNSNSTTAYGVLNWSSGTNIRTGAIVIKTNIAANKSTMVTLRITGNIHTRGKLIDLTIQWFNSAGQIKISNGNFDVPVALGKDSNGMYNIVLGSVTDSWEAADISVDIVNIHYDFAIGDLKNWSVNLLTTLTSLNSISAPFLHEVSVVQTQWSNVKSTPTTALGYGITDVYTKNDIYTKGETDTKYTPVGTAFTKSESDVKYAGISSSYIKTDSDARYMPAIPNNLIMNGQGSIILRHTDAATTTLNGLYWQRGVSQNIAELRPFFNAVGNEWLLRVNINNTTNSADASSSNTGVMEIYGSRIWHKAYGNLHDYFRKVSDSYTKSEVDAITTDIKTTYAQKTYVDTTFATITTANSITARITAEESARVNLDNYSANTYAKKVDYYDKSTSDNRYYLNSSPKLNINHNTDSAYGAGIIFNNASATSDNASILWKSGGVNKGMIYTDNANKMYFYLNVPETGFVASLIVDKDSLWHRAYGYLQDYFRKVSDSYTKVEVDNKVSTTISNYYTKTETDGKYATGGDRDWTNTNVTNLQKSLNDTNTNLANSYYTKPQVYTKGETDAKYMWQNSDSVYAIGSNGNFVANRTSNNNTTGSLYFQRSGQNISMMYAYWNTVFNTWNLRFLFENGTSNTSFSGLDPGVEFCKIGIWHTSYNGWLHDYFRKASDSYTKVEVDNKVNTLAGNVYDKVSSDNNYQPKASMSNYYLKTETYNRTETDNSFIKKTSDQYNVYSDNGNGIWNSGLKLRRVNTNNGDASPLIWAMGNDKNYAMMRPWIDPNGRAEMQMCLNITGNNAENTVITYSINTESIWHRAYGNLHDYFRKVSDSYDKGTSDARFANVANYYDKRVSDGRFAPLKPDTVVLAGDNANLVLNKAGYGNNTSSIYFNTQYGNQVITQVSNYFDGNAKAWTFSVETNTAVTTAGVGDWDPNPVIPILTVNKTGIWAPAYGLLQSYFAQISNIWDRATSDARFMAKTPDVISTYGSGDVLLGRQGTASEIGSGIYWKREAQVLTELRPFYNKDINQWLLRLNINNSTSINDSASSITSTMDIYRSHIWHSAYGNLHDYFAKVSDYYNRVQSDGRYQFVNADTNYAVGNNANFVSNRTGNATGPSVGGYYYQRAGQNIAFHSAYWHSLRNEWMFSLQVGSGGSVNDTSSPVATAVEISRSTIYHPTYGNLHDYFRKVSDSYTKSEVDGKFVALNSDSFQTWGPNANIVLQKTGSNSAFSSSIYFNRNNGTQVLGNMYQSFNTSSKEWEFLFSTNTGTAVTDGSAGAGLVLAATKSKIWTAAYGDLHSYFARRVSDRVEIDNSNTTDPWWAGFRLNKTNTNSGHIGGFRWDWLGNIRAGLFPYVYPDGDTELQFHVAPAGNGNNTNHVMTARNLGIWHKSYGWVHDAFMPKVPDNLATYGAGDIVLGRAGNTSNLGSGIYWRRDGQNLSEIRPFFNTADNRWLLRFNVNPSTDVNDTTSNADIAMEIYPTRIWSRAYGNLHDYFAKQGNHFTTNYNDSYVEGNGFRSHQVGADKANVSGLTFIRNNNVMGSMFLNIDTGLDSSQYVFYAKKPSDDSWWDCAHISIWGLWHRAYGHLHDYFRKVSDSYTKTEVDNINNSIRADVTNGFYSKSQADNKFIALNADTNYAVGNNANFVSNRTGNATGPSVGGYYYQRDGLNIAFHSAYWHTLRNEWMFSIQVGSGGTVNDTSSGVATAVEISRSTIYHPTYGNLHDYFRKVSDSYSIVETDARPGVAKAWVNFKGIPGANNSIAIYRAYNIASVSYRATGIWRITFITPMPSISYCIAGSGKDTDGAGDVFISTGNISEKATTHIDIISSSSNASRINPLEVSVVFFDIW